MVRAILFDFDGVIVDSEPIHYHTFQETLKKFGVKIDEQRWYDEFTGTGSPHIMKVLFEENGIKEDLDKWVKIRRNKLWNYLRNNEIELKKGLKEFLELLEKRGIKRAVTSGSKEDTINFILKKIGIDNYFEIVLGRESIKNRKPDPEIFLLGAKRIGAEPEECLIIEDSISGITAAKKSGIKYICMKSPGNQGLKECAIIISDYTEFPLELLEDK